MTSRFLLDRESLASNLYQSSVAVPDPAGGGTRRFAAEEGKAFRQPRSVNAIYQIESNQPRHLRNGAVDLRQAVHFGEPAAAVR